MSVYSYGIGRVWIPVGLYIPSRRAMRNAPQRKFVSFQPAAGSWQDTKALLTAPKTISEEINFHGGVYIDLCPQNAMAHYARPHYGAPYS